MKESLKAWWSTAEANEKRGLIVLGLIGAGIFLFVSGVTIGRAVAAL